MPIVLVRRANEDGTRRFTLVRIRIRVRIQCGAKHVLEADQRVPSAGQRLQHNGLGERRHLGAHRGPSRVVHRFGARERLLVERRQAHADELVERRPLAPVHHDARAHPCDERIAPARHRAPREAHHHRGLRRLDAPRTLDVHVQARLAASASASANAQGGTRASSGTGDRLPGSGPTSPRRGCRSTRVH